MGSLFRIIQLPRQFDGDNENLTKHLPILIQQSKTLRLKALRTDPSAFGSTYEREVAFDDDVWEARLKNPVAITFVAIDTSHLTSNSDDLEGLNSAVWCGSTILFGPRVTKGDIPTANISAWFRSGSAFKDEDGDNAEPRAIVYAINAVYVDIPYRRQGIAKKLLEAAFQSACSEFKNLKRSTGDVGICMMFVEKGNDAALNLYLRFGFELIGEENYTAADGRTGIALSLQRYLVH